MKNLTPKKWKLLTLGELREMLNECKTIEPTSRLLQGCPEHFRTQVAEHGQSIWTGSASLEEAGKNFKEFYKTCCPGTFQQQALETRGNFLIRYRDSKGLSKFASECPRWFKPSALGYISTLNHELAIEARHGSINKKTEEKFWAIVEEFKRKCVHYYDAKGELGISEFFDFQGNLTGTKIHRYGTNGEMVGTDYYDSKGNLMEA